MRAINRKQSTAKPIAALDPRKPSVEVTASGMTLRIIKGQVYYGPSDIDIYSYSVVGYLNGDKVDRTKGLGLQHFDSFHVIKKSTNPKIGGDYLHVIAYRQLENDYYVLVLVKDEKR